MAQRSTFTIKYAPEVYEHLKSVERKYHRLVAETIMEQLSHTPEAETTNRKSLEQPTSIGATWELRFGPDNCFRVFYEVDRAEKLATVLAIGVKKGSRLFVGGQEFEL